MTQRKLKATGWIILLLVFIIITAIVKLSDTTKPLSNTRNDNNLITAHVTRVVDGDTMKVKLEDGHNTEETIRLLLVDTPETVHPQVKVQPFGPEASALAKRVLTNQEVQLEIDVSERDKYGRLLVYLWIGDQMFNEMLLEEGLARVAYVIPPNIKYIDQFRAIQQKSQKSAKGIWRIENYAQADGFQEDVKSISEAASTNIEIIHITSPIETNTDATLTARVLPGASASIIVRYKGGTSSAAGLESKQADAEGIVSWTWKVSPNTTAGSWSIQVTSGGEHIDTDFIVK